MSRHAIQRIVMLLLLGAAASMLSACGGAQARKVKHLEKGQNYFDVGNLEKARVEFQNALQIAPNDPQTRLDMGLVDEKMGKIQEAAQFFQGVIDIDSLNLGARTHLARLYIFSALPDKALELIKPALDAKPDNSELLALRSAAKVQKKDLDGGRSDAERAVQLDPSNEDAISTLAGVYSSTKDYDKARTLLESGIERNPNSVDLRLVLAQVYGSEALPAEAEKTLVELLHIQPRVKAHRIRLAQFYAGQKQLDAAERVLRDGIAALPAERDLKLALIDFLQVRRSPEIAEKELTALIAADPKDFELKFALAKFYQANRQQPRAEELYRQVIDSEKLDAAGLAARDRLATLLVQRNDADGAQKLMSEVLAKSPRDNDALVLRGTMELANKEPKGAIADLRTVLRDQPNSIGVLRALAHAHVANGEAAIGEESLRRALEIDPADAGLRLDLAQLLLHSGKPAQAQIIAEGLVKERPADVADLDTLFRASAGNKDYEKARAAARALVAADPKSGLGYYFQGLLEEEGHHTDDALRLYAQAVDAEPDALEPLDAEVRLLVKSKRVGEATKRLDEIVARSPAAPFAPFIKGEMLSAQGDLFSAEAAYRLAISKAPGWWQPYHALADSEFAAKRSGDALATLRLGQSRAVEKEALSLEIARYLDRSGKSDDAIQEYEAIVRANPQSEIAANNLAMILVTYKKDAASLDRAKTLTTRFADSGNPSFLDTYGWVLFKHGEAAASVPVLQQVVSKAPGEPVALYHLGMAQSQVGSSTDALSNLTRAVNSGKQFNGIDDARAALEKLTKSQADVSAKS